MEGKSYFLANLPEESIQQSMPLIQALAEEYYALIHANVSVITTYLETEEKSDKVMNAMFREKAKNDKRIECILYIMRSLGLTKKTVTGNTEILDAEQIYG